MTPFSNPCANDPCPGVVSRLGDLCRTCQRRGLAWLQEDIDQATLVWINGEKQSLCDPSQVKRKHVHVHMVDGWKMQACKAVPVVIVEKKGAALPKQSLTKAEAEQP